MEEKPDETKQSDVLTGPTRSTETTYTNSHPVLDDFMCLRLTDERTITVCGDVVVKAQRLK